MQHLQCNARILILGQWDRSSSAAARTQVLESATMEYLSTIEVAQQLGALARKAERGGQDHEGRLLRHAGRLLLEVDPGPDAAALAAELRPAPGPSVDSGAEERRARVLELREEGYTHRAIAEVIGCSPRAVTRILCGR